MEVGGWLLQKNESMPSCKFHQVKAIDSCNKHMLQEIQFLRYFLLPICFTQRKIQTIIHRRQWNQDVCLNFTFISNKTPVLNVQFS